MELLGGVVQFFVEAFFMSVFSLTGDVGRRHQALRNAGLNRTGARSSEWSPEAIAIVLDAFDPARLAPRRGETGLYRSAAHAIFDAAPVYESTERSAFAPLVSGLVSALPDSSPAPRALDGVTTRLLEMHDAAFQRLHE